MGKSSKDKRDAYYRLAKEQGWRARSAFKLLQLDEEFDLFAGVTRVVDLCAAPGSWSQVLSRVLVRGERFGRAQWQDRHARIIAGLPGADTPSTATPAEETPAERKAEGEKPEDEKQVPDKTEVKIVAIDLQPMSPLPGVITLQADITDPSTIPRILKALDPEKYNDDDAEVDRVPNPVDLIVSDGAPDVTGLHDLDIYVQSQLIHAALQLALRVLRPGGTFVAKIFRGRDADLLYAQFRTVFGQVVVAKPRSSRASSLEAFLVCRDFRPLPSPEPLPDPSLVGDDGPNVSTLESGRIVEADKETETKEPTRRVRDDGVTELLFDVDGEDVYGSRRWVAPFLACGDLSAFDSDATYKLPPNHVSLDPVQPPVAPPYKRALEMRKKAGGAYGKTKAQQAQGEVSVK